MKKNCFKLSVLSLSLSILPTFAVTPVDLAHQASSLFMAKNAAIKIEEVNRSADFNQTLHVRVQQTYQGYPVWGGDAVVHIPKAGKSSSALSDLMKAKTSMNGMVYQNIANDLANYSPVVFSQAQADNMLQQAITTYQQKIGNKVAVKNHQAQLIVFIDKNNKAHWAYKISFDASGKKLPAKPVYIVDALSFVIYQQWDDIKTASDFAKKTALGGGNGGNTKMGKLIYDGLATHLPTLNIKRDEKLEKCYLQNKDVTVKNMKNKIIQFSCKTPDTEHNNVYWSGALEEVNGGYSPPNDALFDGAVIKDMYMKWYKVPPLVKPNGSPMMLNMIVHADMDNAYWDGKKMVFGDGIDMFYPLTSLGVGAHEISHGFTEQHSNLVYEGQSGGINEAYSDMAAQAAEFFAYGKNSWQIGPEIFKAPEAALRYMDTPSKDCGQGAPGEGCSIDKASQYTDGLDVHYSSGVYNRLFYLLGTSAGWDTKKAFDVMVKANMHYWTSTTDYNHAACGILSAAKDYGYDTEAVVTALKTVEIDTSKC